VVEQGAHNLFLLDPLGYSPHEVAEDTQSRNVRGKQQAPAAETVCCLANGLPPVLLENQMVERPHEQNSVESCGWHCIQVSRVSHDKPCLSVQGLRLKPELTSFQQGR